jgi:hypothetical protein
MTPATVFIWKRRTNMAAEYIVLLSRPESVDVMALARALAAVRKTPLQDQISVAKSAWGIVAEHLPENAARSLCDALNCASIPTTVCEEHSLVALPEPELIRRIEPGWSEGLSLIAAVTFTQSSTTGREKATGPSAAQRLLNTGIFLTTGLPIHVGPKKQVVKSEKTQSELAFYLDLYYTTPMRCRRIDGLQFDYSFLKDRRTYQALANFKQLLQDCVAGSPNALQNLGTRTLVRNQPLTGLGYSSLSDLERESRWLLTLRTRSALYGA